MSKSSANKTKTASRKRVLVFTHVFPNASEPNFGVFIKKRMEHVARHLPVLVVAPVPWFPLLHKFRKSHITAIPRVETIDGLTVHHPRFFYIPGLLKFLDALFLFCAMLPYLRKLRKSFRFDLIDAHFAYPDGVAAWMLARKFNIPFSVTLRGSLLAHSRHLLKRLQIRRCLNNADSVISVSLSLSRFVEQAYKIAGSKIQVIPNGIDKTVFKPESQNLARKRLNLPENHKILVTVGGLTKRKGIDRVIRLLPGLQDTMPDILYVVIGGASREGDERNNLSALVRELELDDTVLFLGPLSHSEIVRWLNAADVFVLLTANEGCANVIMEALACGLPVVTTDVGGNPELIVDGANGFLVELNNHEGVLNSLLTALRSEWKRDDITASINGRTWGKVAAEVMACIDKI